MTEKEINEASGRGTKMAQPCRAPSDGSETASYITFKVKELTPNPATKRWAVMSKDQGSQIGMVSWYGPWRKYCFFPMASTVYEQVCLRDIANFCESQTKAHREAKKPKESTAAGALAAAKIIVEHLTPPGYTVRKSPND